MKKYTSLQLDHETHTILKKYCAEHDKKMAPLVSRIIKEYISRPKPTNVLYVR